MTERRADIAVESGLPAAIGGGSRRAERRRLLLRRFLRNRTAVVGVIVLVALVALALVGPALTHDPYRQDLDGRLAGPSPGHPLGTDSLGRDLAARVVAGARVSVGVGLLTASLALAIGVPLGALAGFRGGWTDAAISRAIEAMLCFPTLLLVLTLLTSAPAAVRGLPDTVRLALAMGLTGWIPVARYLRAEFLGLRRSDRAEAARALGCGPWRVAIVHLLPGALAPVLVTAAFTVGGAIGLEAALSFLGLGVGPPVATWGTLLAESREHRAWWLVVFPGAMLFVAVLGCNLLGEGLRDRLDPAGGRG